MTNREKVRELVGLVEERSKFGNDIQWAYVTGWLSATLTEILDGNTTIDKELEHAKTEL